MGIIDPPLIQTNNNLHLYREGLRMSCAALQDLLISDDDADTEVLDLDRNLLSPEDLDDDFFDDMLD